MNCDVPDHKRDDNSKGKLAAQPLVFPFMVEIRRSAVYVLVGVVLIPLIRWWLRDFLPYRGVADLVFGVVLVVLVAVGAIGVLRWRLKVDDQGIWRRRLIGWDLWPW